MAILETIFCKIFGVISTILEKVGGEKITSCIHFNDNKHTLEENLQVLVSKASDIKTKVENVEVLGKKKRTTEVGKWMENVAKLKKDFDEIQEAGFCKPLMHGSHVKKLIEGVAELTKQCQTFHELLIDGGETSGVRLFPTRLHSKTLTEESDKMLEWLEAESDQVPCIGICGMGGVGKTTLAEYICKHLQDNAGGIYVYRLIVSQKVDINKLQKDLAKQLNCLDQVKEDDVEEWASILNRVLIEKKNVVLLFDDVWKYFDLSKIGIPLGVNGCKVIMTSRLLQVCNQMGCNKYIVKLQPLSEEDAWKLFLEKLGCAYELSPEVEKVAKIMANKCDGLPLAIITLARSMSGVYGIHEWKDALEELNQSFMGQYDIKKRVLPILQHSYNRLRDSRWQQCFLYCSLYPEDSEMLIDELINQFIYEGLMDRRHSRAAEFDQGHTILNRLVNASLLESVDELKLEVKMHDLLREMAVEITRNNPRFTTKAGLQLHELPDEQEWTEDLDNVSLMRKHISEIPVDSSPRCPRLSTLIFSNNPLKLIPSSFFANMGGLKVLDLRDTQIEKLPNSLSELENLTALLLGGCRYLWYVPSLSKLKELRELDLSETEIKEVPDGMGCLVKLKCLKMSGMYKLVEISRGLIPRLSCLQCLILPDHVKVQAEELESLKLLEEFKGWVDDKFNSKWFDKSPPFNVYDIMVSNQEDDKVWGYVWDL